MKEMLKSFKEQLNNEKMVIACSCGVDSSVLLDVALNLFEKENIIVAHVNHNKRKESVLEQEYIESFCKNKEIKLYVLTLEKEYVGNFQEWAREKRYEFFKKVAKETGAKYILLAHHANDLLETILMRLTKQSSLKGYAGIEQCTLNDDVYIYRPFLYTPKDKLIEYAKQNNITYFEDSSNSLDDYTRNRIRHHVIPLLLEENPNLFEAVKKYSETILSANKLLEKVKLEFIENKVTVNNNSVSFKTDDLLSLDEDIRIHVLFRVLRKYSLSRVCLDDIYKQIISKKQNIVTRINNELSMIKEYKTIIFTEEDITKQDFYLKINEDGIYKLLNNQEIKVDKNICYLTASSKTLWYNIKSFPIIIRTRVDGDKIKLKTGTKSVSNFLTDKKVPYMQRKDTLVLCDEFDNILYILGYITK